MSVKLHYVPGVVPELLVKADVNAPIESKRFAPGFVSADHADEPPPPPPTQDSAPVSSFEQSSFVLVLK